MNATTIAACTAHPLEEIKKVVYDPLLTTEAFEKCGHGLVTIGMTALDPQSPVLFNNMSARVFNEFTDVGEYQPPNS